jgi:hypothetical protein
MWKDVILDTECVTFNLACVFVEHDIYQLLNEVEHDMKNYQARSLPLSTEAEG